MTIQACPARAFKLRLRIPEYAGQFSVTVNGVKEANVDIVDGYAIICRNWISGDGVELELDMQPVLMAAHPYVHDNNGKIAIQYGPLLYCVEETDNDMQDITVPENCPLTLRLSESLPGVQEILFEDTLYRCVVAIPYFAWANRGQGRMQVWINKEKYKTLPANEWGDELYKQYKDI
jgi:DUF1680 family protein